jgi:alginate O-acetyltransferase complex protein AlgI
MLFNSLDFAIFLPIVFCIYWMLGRAGLKIQTFFILLASLFFYGWWDWRFLGLIVLSSVIDFFCGIVIYSNSARGLRRPWVLWLSLVSNLGLLFFFKYFNFFSREFSAAFSFFGVEFSQDSLEIVLPVGISFYTFQTLSYSIDVWRGNLKPVNDPIVFLAFVSFFPQLVAGPIERAFNLLPQFQEKRKFDYREAVTGLRQILWGLFKKMVIADNCAVSVNEIFDNPGNYNGSVLCLGAILFAFQIYGDFSGYSDIALGTGRLFGFKLMRNFNYPYFSRDIAEFWRRWHISLSTWFRDYLYIPLGGSRTTLQVKIRNTFLVFLISGFWHGANWTFVVWGLLHAIFYLPLLVMAKNRTHLDPIATGRLFPSFRELYSIGKTFFIVCFAWIFFRAESLSAAVNFISDIPNFIEGAPGQILLFLLKPHCLFVALLVVVEWSGRNMEFPLDFGNLKVPIPVVFRWGVYLFFSLLITLYAVKMNINFIYFQF